MTAIESPDIVATRDGRIRLDVRIQYAVDLVSGNHDKPLGVPDLARAVGLSVSYFSHLFRDNVGVSPAKFLWELRMREAEQLVKTTTLPVRAILESVGATDHSHFVRRFARRYGLAPSRYRAEGGRSVKAAVS
jgi:transcriptional regulator GlxA family with amidase domain